MNRQPDRVPPQDLDAEMALIGSMMADGSVIDEVLAIVPGPEFFYQPAHGKLFQVLADIHTQGKAIDLLIVSDELRKRGLIDFIGGIEYMVRLAESFGDYTRAPHYAKVVSRKHGLRELIRLSVRMEDEAYLAIEDPDDLAAKYASQIDATRTVSRNSDPECVTKIAWRVADRFGCGEGVQSFVRTGFLRFDNTVGGLPKPGLTVIAARPSVGKTAWGMQVAMALAASGVRSLFVSAEMTRDEIGVRYISSGVEVASRVWPERFKTKDDFEAAVNVVNARHGDQRLFVVDGRRGIRDIAAIIRSNARKGAEIAIIDYLQLLRPSKSQGRRDLDLGEIIRDAKTVALDANISVVMLAQLNREAVKTGEEPMMHHIRECGEVEEAADVIGFLWRAKESESSDVETMFKLSKNRNGPLYRDALSFHRPTTRFRELVLG